MRKTGISLALVLSLLTLLASFLVLSHIALGEVEGSATAVWDTLSANVTRVDMAGAMVTAVPAQGSLPGAGMLQLPTVTPMATVVPTATAVSPCNVSTEDFTTHSNEVALRLVNHGPRLASIHAVEIAWPVSDNGPLTAVRLADRVIWRGEKSKSPAIVVPDPTSIAPPSILPGESAMITFVFAMANEGDEVAETHYTVGVSFLEGCRVLYSTRQPNVTTCQVDAGLFAVRGHKAVLTLHNSGATDAELRAIQVAWPVEHNGALVQVKAGNMTLWEGERASSPTIVRPTEATTSPVLHAGERMLLTFIFAESAADEPYTMTHFFIEGCYAFFSTHLKPTTPRTVRLGGAIEALPEDGLLGGWTVAGHSLLVDDRTIVDPQNAQPAVGDEAKVTAIVLQNSTQIANSEQLLAIYIGLSEDKGGRNIEFRGTIREISSDGQEIIIRGITVIINDQTQIRGQLAVGSLAYVKGKLRGNNTVLAEQIVLVSVTADVASVQFEGPVESFPPGWLGEWRIGGRAVTVDASTVIEGTPAIGTLAEVQAQLQDNGTLLARHVVIQEQRVTPVAARISGVIVELPDTLLLLGDWIIGSVADSGNVTVSVTEATFIDQSQARARVGAPVDVNMVHQPDGVWHAIRITVKRED